MTDAPGAAILAGRRLRALRFLRFCVVGGVGFCVDAAILLTLIHLFGAGPMWGRIGSFSVAVLATFEMNRAWAFRGSATQGFWHAFSRYLVVQGFGFCCNFLIYAALYVALPSPFNDPLLCLVAASGCALLINYAGTSHLVFRVAGRPTNAVTRSSDEGSSSGRPKGR